MSPGGPRPEQPGGAPAAPSWFKAWDCSRCDTPQTHEVRPALSRRDGRSLICPRCGVLEALESWLGPVEAARVLDDVMAAEAAARDLVAADLEEVGRHLRLRRPEGGES